MPLEIKIGNRTKASALKDSHHVIFENSLKIARAFRRVIFERLNFQMSRFV